MADFIQQQGQDDRHRKSEKDTHQAQDDRVAQNAPEIIIGKRLSEILESGPGTAKQSFDRVIIFERNHGARHGDVMKHDEIDNRRDKKQIKLIVFFNASDKPDPRLVVERMVNAAGIHMNHILYTVANSLLISSNKVYSAGNA